MSVNPSYGEKLDQRREKRRAEKSDDGRSRALDRLPRVLVVDDEPEITRSVAELLGSDYEVITAGSAEEGIRLLESDSVAVILTDQRMPGGTGAELLARSLDISPETTRILFTGYSDISAVIDAVNEGHVYRYISKPWRPEELKAVVGQGLERYRLVVENRRLLAELTKKNTQLRTMNRTLRESNDQLGVAIHAKNDFLASMSHELRTPLNSIIGFSGMLLQGLAGDLNEEQSRQLQMVSNSGQRLLTLVETVLDLAKIDSGHSEPAIDEVDAASIVREACELMRPMAQAKGLDLRFTCPDGIASVRTDGRFVGRILLNLLGNAIKFTDSGHVSASVCQDASGTSIAVEDTGCGVAPDDLEHIFEDYYQGMPRDAVKYAGTGLGLPVSSRLAEALGASIEVTSEEGRGSVFTLRVPMGDSDG